MCQIPTYSYPGACWNEGFPTREQFEIFDADARQMVVVVLNDKATLGISVVS